MCKCMQTILSKCSLYSGICLLITPDVNVFLGLFVGLCIHHKVKNCNIQFYIVLLCLFMNQLPTTFQIHTMVWIYCIKYLC